MSEYPKYLRIERKPKAFMLSDRLKVVGHNDTLGTYAPDSAVNRVCKGEAVYELVGTFADAPWGDPKPFEVGQELKTTHGYNARVVSVRSIEGVIAIVSQGEFERAVEYRYDGTARFSGTVGDLVPEGPTRVALLDPQGKLVDTRSA